MHPSASPSRGCACVNITSPFAATAGLVAAPQASLTLPTATFGVQIYDDETARVLPLRALEAGTVTIDGVAVAFAPFSHEGDCTYRHTHPPRRLTPHSVRRSVPIYSLEFLQLADVARFFVCLKHVAALGPWRRAADGRRC